MCVCVDDRWKSHIGAIEAATAWASESVNAHMDSVKWDKKSLSLGTRIYMCACECLMEICCWKRAAALVKLLLNRIYSGNHHVIASFAVFVYVCAHICVYTCKKRGNRPRTENKCSLTFFLNSFLFGVTAFYIKFKQKKNEFLGFLLWNKKSGKFSNKLQKNALIPMKPNFRSEFSWIGLSFDCLFDCNCFKMKMQFYWIGACMCAAECSC